MTSTPSPFDRAADLVRVLGAARLPTAHTLAQELALGTEISLWDVVAPVLALYRFPLLFAWPDKQRWRLRASQRLWSYRGRLAQWRDWAIGPRLHARLCPEWPGGARTALFLSFSPQFDRDVLEPVATSMSAREHWNVVALGNGSNSAHGSRTSSGRTHPIWNHWTAAVEQRAATMRNALSRVRRLVDVRRLMPPLAEAGYHFHHTEIAPEIDWLFWREFRRLIPPLAIAEHLLRAHRPAVIVSPDNADQRCRLYALLGRQLGIPVLIVQQGLVGGNYGDWRFLCADKIAAMGETSAELIAQQGVARDTIVITGHPGFDMLNTMDPARRSTVRNTLGVPQGHALVVFASQPYVPGAFASTAARRTLLREVAEAAVALPGTTFVVKPHPCDTVREARRLFAAAPVKIVDPALDIRPLIASADVLVTFFSTSALQALAAGTPVINLVQADGGSSNPYVNSGATWVARSACELKELIGSLIGPMRDRLVREREPARLKFVQEWAYTPDGAAANRVARLADTLAIERSGASRASA